MKTLTVGLIIVSNPPKLTTRLVLMSKGYTIALEAHFKPIETVFESIGSQIWSTFSSRKVSFSEKLSEREFGEIMDFLEH